MKKDFITRLKEAIHQEPLLMDEVVGQLREIAEVVRGMAKPNVEVDVVPGFATVHGQQFNFSIKLIHGDYVCSNETLFRAYVPTGGYPVHLDLMQEDLTVCVDAQEFQNAILGFFARPAVRCHILGFLK